MTEREKLMELLSKAPLGNYPLGEQFSNGTVEKIADYLLENGVIMPPVKIGDMVWDNDFGHPQGYDVTGFDVGRTMDNEVEHSELFVYCESWGGTITFSFPVSAIGKTVFLTREEAEKALAERSG